MLAFEASQEFTVNFKEKSHENIGRIIGCSTADITRRRVR
jgi:hypothetical protein